MNNSQTTAFDNLTLDEETREILSDKKLMRAIRQGEKEINAGKGIDWEDFKKELKLKN